MSDPLVKINDFWSWFEQHKGVLKDSDSRQTIEELSTQMDQLALGLGWEIGPISTQKYFFALSPKKDAEKLSLCKKAIKLAPSLKNWEFLPAKPRKLWKRRVEISLKGNRILVAFDDWKYSLTAYDNRAFFDVVFIPYMIDGLVEEDYNKLALMFVEAELGEEVMMDIIGSITTQAVPDVDVDLTPAMHFFDHLCSLSDNNALQKENQKRNTEGRWGQRRERRKGSTL